MSKNDSVQTGVLALSIVIPAYNEEQRIGLTLDQTIEYFAKKQISYEIIVVDDGSKDKTKIVVDTYCKKLPLVKLLALEKNSGKGAAVSAGVVAAQGNVIIYMDADGATPIEEIERLFREIEAGAHIAIGSRALFSSETAIKTIWTRKLIGRIFNLIVNIFVLPAVADTQCGFKMFRKIVAHEIFPRLKSSRFAFDVEILYLARKMGCIIAEVPINWNNVPGSKVNIISDSTDMLFDILTIPFRKYGKLPQISNLEN
ncbi:MAG: glycosyltransferase family 2 protein [Deltaproteobacteria bacterium]|nr:glycosyltransferase family 2 protein [Deltaproteobacteria bacterium]